jgi:hypothetical protein
MINFGTRPLPETPTMKHILHIASFALMITVLPATAQVRDTGNEQKKEAGTFQAEKDLALAQLIELRDELQHSVASWGREMGGSPADRQERLREASEAAKAEITNVELAIKRVELAGEGDWPAVKELAEQRTTKAREVLERLSQVSKS